MTHRVVPSHERPTQRRRRDTKPKPLRCTLNFVRRPRRKKVARIRQVLRLVDANQASLSMKARCRSLTVAGQCWVFTSFPWTSNVDELFSFHGLSVHHVRVHRTSWQASPMAVDENWTWQYLGSDGAPIMTPPAPAVDTGFGSQVDAESWLGDVWRELLDAGIDAVSLMNRDEMVYGPMSLHPPA